MRKRWLVGLGIVTILTVVAVGTGGIRRSHAPVKAPSREYVVRRDDVRMVVRETGTVEPLTKVEVKSKVGGRIMQMAVEEGEAIRVGDLIAQIDPIEIESQVRQFQAQIDASRARLRQAQTERDYQSRSYKLALADAEQGLRSSAVRLTQAKRQSRAQPTLTNASIAQAQANLNAARASLVALRQSTHPQVRADARAALEQALTNVGNAQRQLRRMEALQERGFVSVNQVDDAKKECDNACSQRDAAQQRMNTLDERLAAEVGEAEARVAQSKAAFDHARAEAVQDDLRADDLSAAEAARGQAMVAQQRAQASRAQVRSRDEEIEAARAIVKQLTDQLDEVKVRLQDTTIRAPMSGTVARRYIEAGELVTSGIATFSSGMPLIQIADLSRMRVVCQINEVDVSRVRLGQRAEINLDAARGQTYIGRVVSVAPSAGARTPGETQGGGAGSASAGLVKFQVKIAVDRNDGALKPGMTADVDIITDERRGVLVLPLDAVSLPAVATKSASPSPEPRAQSPEPRAQRATVTLLEGKGDALKKKDVTVETGLKNETVVEIRKGLKKGDRVGPAPYKGAPRKGLDLPLNAGAGN